MKETQKPGHVSKGNVLSDLGLSSKRSAVEKMKYEIHKNILLAIDKNQLTPRELERILDKPQPRISELLTGKIAGISIELLLGYLELLGGEAKINCKVKKIA